MPPLPPRVQAALAYLAHCESLTYQGDTSVPARALGEDGERVRRSALRVLSLYFECEMDFGDVPPTSGTRDDEEEPPARVETPV